MLNWREKIVVQDTGPVSDRRPPRPNWRALWLMTLLSLPLALVFISLDYTTDVGSFLRKSVFGCLNNSKICPQADVLYPDHHAQLWERLGKDFSQDSFTVTAVEWLRGAVRIP